MNSRFFLSFSDLDMCIQYNIQRVREILKISLFLLSQRVLILAILLADFFLLSDRKDSKRVLLNAVGVGTHIFFLFMLWFRKNKNVCSVMHSFFLTTGTVTFALNDKLENGVDIVAIYYQLILIMVFAVIIN
jgi:predicted neutral ceramidase superfamily lipid hydrolase